MTTWAARLARPAARLLFGAADQVWLAPIMARALPGAGLVLATSLTAAALGLAAPLLTGSLIDQGIMARDMNALLFWAGVGFAVGLGAVGLGIVNAMLHLRASARMLADLRGQVMAAALARDPRLPDPPIGETAARIDGDSAEIQRFAFDSVLTAVGAVFRLVGGTILMASLDWRLTLLPALAAPLELWFLSRTRPETARRAEEVREARGELSAHLTESLAARATLRGLGAESRRMEAFHKLQDRQIGGLLRQRIWGEMVGAFGQILTAIMRAGVLLIGGWLVIQGHWGIGSLVAFLAYTGMMSGPLRNLLGLYHAQARAQVALKRLSGLMAAAVDPRAGRALGEAAPLLEFRAARAAGGRHEPLSFTLRPGERVLIDGPSGVGKSRLMALLTGAAPLETGEVLMGGIPVGEIRRQDLQARILHLEQRPTALRGSLAENLRLGAPEAGEAALWEALEVVGLALWARERKGLATPIGETGADLSGGMRQRIALARGLLRPAAVLIFDESFSEIDDEACRRILARIEAEQTARLRIFIAHAGPAREGDFDQRITLSASAPILRKSRGETPSQRESAREKAV
ncbi:ABC transporter ATP-binding protein [Neomegalonema perideroedes]|uniref:ABC transporter ATP-binding protein n=1 Tax=Neomegalonema perideroedes TaxID=217219 RepID=UPI000380109C|nr:ABC transporter ATP-binding protein [Neomegalonema perideroedes]